MRKQKQKQKQLRNNIFSVLGVTFLFVWAVYLMNHAPLDGGFFPW